MGKGEQVSEAVQSLVAQLTRERLTPLMKESFLCCAECCDNESSQQDLQAWYGTAQISSDLSKPDTSR